MVARRWSFRSSTSRMVSMSSMLPILSLMLSEAGASLMGQLAVLGQFEALPHALHADRDVAAVGKGREGIGRLHAGLLPAQRRRVFVAGEIRNRVVLCGRDRM